MVDEIFGFFGRTHEKCEYFIQRNIHVLHYVEQV